MICLSCGSRKSYYGRGAKDIIESTESLNRINSALDRDMIEIKSLTEPNSVSAQADVCEFSSALVSF